MLNKIEFLSPLASIYFVLQTKIRQEIYIVWRYEPLDVPITFGICQTKRTENLGI